MKYADIFNTNENIFPNGLKATVTRMSGADSIHEVVLGEVLYKIIAEEASAHQESFDGKGFNNVLSAVRNNEIQAYFLVITENNTMPKIVGGAIQYSTVFTEWDGAAFSHYPAVYSEDTYVSKEASASFREKTTCPVFPKGLGLGTFFVCERIRLSATGDKDDLPFGMTARSRVAEHALGNKHITSIYEKLNARHADKDINTILYFEGKPSKIGKLTHCRICIESLSSKNEAEKFCLHPNIFVASWKSDSGSEQIVVTFTQAISTFTGEASVRVQITTNKRLPNTETLKAVLLRLLEAGSSEIVRREWKLLGASPFETEDEVFSVMKVHALGETGVVRALEETGAKSRFLGLRPMCPNVVDFLNIPVDVFGKALPVSTAFVERMEYVVEESDLASNI